MVQSPDEAHYRMIADRVLNGAVVPFLGAGVNLCGRPDSATFALGQYLPSGSELAAHLASQLDYPYTDRTDLLRVSQYVDVILGDGPLYGFLHDVFDEDYAPTAVHRLLATVPALIRMHRSDRPKLFPLYVTTNYDDALERAFRDADEPYDLVTYIADNPDRGKFLHTRPDDKSRVISLPHKYKELNFGERPVIMKIHGAVARGTNDRDSFVVTEDDYIDYLSMNDTTHLFPIDIAQRMKKSHLLFLGYSLKDWNLRVILRRIWGDSVLNWNSWAIQPKPEKIEEKTWDRRHVELLDARLEEYVTHLAAALAVSAAAEGRR
jgi:hypothetical protein